MKCNSQYSLYRDSILSLPLCCIVARNAVFSYSPLSNIIQFLTVNSSKLYVCALFQTKLFSKLPTNTLFWFCRQQHQKKTSDERIKRTKQRKCVSVFLCVVNVVLPKAHCSRVKSNMHTAICVITSFQDFCGVITHRLKLTKCKCNQNVMWYFEFRRMCNGSDETICVCAPLRSTHTYRTLRCSFAFSQSNLKIKRFRFDIESAFFSRHNETGENPSYEMEF